MLILFWPFMLASIVLAFLAIGKKKPLFLVIACFLILPFSLYLAATPLFKGWGLLLPLLYVAAAFALKKNLTWLSIILVLPVIILIGWLAFVVVMQ